MRLNHFFEGRFHNQRAKGGIEVVNPANGSVVGYAPDGGQKEIGAAVRSARKAFEGWSALGVEKRVDYLNKLLASLESMADELALAITTEVGTPLRHSKKFQVGVPLYVLKLYTGLSGETETDSQNDSAIVFKRPAGVAAAITAWNYPLHQMISKLAPALLMGCPVVIKPSEIAPGCADILARAAMDANIPAGVINIIHGTGGNAGASLAAHPMVDVVSFTGSSRVGKKVAAMAAASVKRVGLELGGKSASLVLRDADLREAVEATVDSCMLNAGQTCFALTRLLVPFELRKTAEELAMNYASTFTPGDPLSPDCRLGPLASSNQQSRVRNYIRSGVRDGARLLCGGPQSPKDFSNGFYVMPTVFGGVKPHMKIAMEEIFGPVLSVIPYKSEKEAVDILNCTKYGLYSALWTRDNERGVKLSSMLRCGRVDVNTRYFNCAAPFGGFKESGVGRELGKYGLELYFEYQSVQLPPSR